MDLRKYVVEVILCDIQNVWLSFLYHFLFTNFFLNLKSNLTIDLYLIYII